MHLLFEIEEGEGLTLGHVGLTPLTILTTHTSGVPCVDVRANKNRNKKTITITRIQCMYALCKFNYY